MPGVTPLRSELFRPTIALAILMGVIVAFAVHGTANAATFNPISAVCLDDQTTVDPDPKDYASGHPSQCDGDNTPGANSAYTQPLSVDAGDSQFGTLIRFVPPEWGVAKDADVPDGALIGKIDVTTFAALLNGACSNPILPSFSTMDATTDMSVQTNVVEQFLDDDGDGLPNGVEMYPDYLARIVPGLQPRARMYGQEDLAGGAIKLSINFLIFEPGVPVFGLDLDPTLGYPIVFFILDTGDPGAEPAPIPLNDFCTPLTTSQITFGMTEDNPVTAPDEGGVAYRTNPGSDGTYNFLAYGGSIPDADDDGLTNDIDTCPFDPDPNFDMSTPGAKPEDPDLDWIPTSCDPKPNESTGLGDHDFDGFSNRGDNCPLDANPLQKDSDNDFIGDACDPNPTTLDGHIHVVCNLGESDAIVIGAGGLAPFGKEDLVCDQAQVTVLDSTSTLTPTPAPTATPLPDSDGDGVADADSADGAATGTGAAGGAATGVGSLAPAVSSIPMWAAIVTALGSVGVLGAVGAFLKRVFDHRN